MSVLPFINSVARFLYLKTAIHISSQDKPHVP